MCVFFVIGELGTLSLSLALSLGRTHARTPTLTPQNHFVVEFFSNKELTNKDCLSKFFIATLGRGTKREQLLLSASI